MANPLNVVFNAANGSVYRSPGALTPKQQAALVIYAQVLQLKAIGGIDYTNALTTTLVSDAQKNTIGMLEGDIDAQFIDTEFSQAVAQGATVPATLSGKLAVCNCLLEVDPLTLRAMFLQLNRQLGINKSYPQ